MAGFGKTNWELMPTITGYKSALKHYHSVKHIRGSSSTWKPIARRSDDTKKMAILHDDSVAFRLHNTDVITVHPDDTVTIKAWPSRLTADFISNLVFAVKGGFREALGMRVEINGQCYFPSKGGLVLRWNDGFGSGWEVVSGAEQQFEYKLNAKKAAEARKKLDLAITPLLVLQRLENKLAGYMPNEYRQIVRDYMAGRVDAETATKALMQHGPLTKARADGLRRYAYQACGAIETVDVPMGKLPKDSPWDPSKG